ncbi:hypothetical protein ABPG74_019493 [Tetrahymena malaccensis]
MEGLELISQGAEAKVYKVKNFLGEPAIMKEKLVKAYRHPDLDQRLSKERITFEVRNMIRARKAGINTPYVMQTDFVQRKIYMQYIDGLKLRDFLFQNQKTENMTELLKEVGRILAKLHDSHIIHGDLTTSNIMVTHPVVETTKSYGQIYLIDFGLSYVKDSIEEKAVDLYVLERAFISTHPELENEFQELLQEYKRVCKQGDKTIKKLNDVRMRGRKKVAFG